MMRDAQSYTGTDKPNQPKQTRTVEDRIVPEGQIAKLIAARTDSLGYIQPDIHIIRS